MGIVVSEQWESGAFMDSGVWGVSGASQGLSGECMDIVVSEQWESGAFMDCGVWGVSIGPLRASQESAWA